MQTNKSKIVHSENLRHRPEGDVWDRSYDTLRQPIRLGIRPEENPTRVQPLRAARLPSGDREWYNTVHPFDETGPDEDQSDPEDAENTQVSPRTFSADPATGTGFVEPQHGPPMAPGDPTVYSPPSPDSGEHEQSPPPSEKLQTSHERLETPHGYSLRSRGPVLTPELLEGHKNVSNSSNSDRGKRPLEDSCCEEPADKRLREEIDVNSLTIEPYCQTDSLPPPPPLTSHDMKRAHRSVSSILFPHVYNLVISALDTWFPGMI